MNNYRVEFLAGSTHAPLVVSTQIIQAICADAAGHKAALAMRRSPSLATSFRIYNEAGDLLTDRRDLVLAGN